MPAQLLAGAPGVGYFRFADLDGRPLDGKSLEAREVLSSVPDDAMDAAAQDDGTATGTATG